MIYQVPAKLFALFQQMALTALKAHTAVHNVKCSEMFC